MNAPSLNTIEAFLAVADAGGFGAAAERLGLTSSAVSRAIARLEHHFDVKLFVRTTRKVSLTPEGAILCQRFRGVLNDLETIADELQDRGRAVRGRLRLSMPATYGRKVILPLLNSFVEAYPALELDLNFTDRYVDLIDESVDAAVRIGDVRDPNLIARAFDSAGFGIFGAPDYLAKHGRPGQPTDLQTHALLAYHHPGSGQHYPWQLSHDGEPSRVVPDGAILIDNGEALVDAAIQGLGLVYVQGYMVRDALERGELEGVMDAYWPAPTSVRLVYHEPRYYSPRVGRFIDWLTGVFSSTNGPRA